METQCVHNLFERRCITKAKTPAVKWFREWVPQDVVATGGRCKLLKWVNENTLKALKEKAKEPEAQEIEPEPTTEVLFLCSYEGCGKTFIDAGTLRKHSHIHGERQYFCHYKGCGKVSCQTFLNFLPYHFWFLVSVLQCSLKILKLRTPLSSECLSIKLSNGKQDIICSKLKRHFLIQTGERDFVCPVEGCGKAFSLDINLRSHMKTHSQENYHVCPYPDCGKRYAYEYKLKNHISSQHEKNPAVDVTKYATPLKKTSKATKSSGGGYSSAASADRPYACPYKGCEKAYIHEYKLKLHLKREHPGHVSDENAAVNAENEMYEASDQDAYAGKRCQRQQSRAKPTTKMPPSKLARKGSTSSPAALNVTKKPWPLKKEVSEEEDSEETEEDRENDDDGWRYGKNNEEDDEETEYED